MYRDKSPNRIIESFLFKSDFCKITLSKLSTLKTNAKIMNFKDIFSLNLFYENISHLLNICKGSEIELRQFINASIVFIDNTKFCFL